MFSINHFRQQFPILSTFCDSHPLVYLDNGATTQKPKAVIESSRDYYQQSNANVHRASHFLSAKATKAFETVRSQVQRFINASSEKEIIWTKGTTESINIIAQCYGLKKLKAGDEIVISQAEHHANIVPWQHVTQTTGAKLVVLPINKKGEICLESAKKLITPHCKILSITHISNVLGKINPVTELVTMAKGVGAISVIDGAQAIAHLDVNVQKIDCDFYVYSAHKMFGPNGIGVLYGKKKHLDAMPPYQFGGEMIKHVSFEKTTYNELPHKFEAGTPNIVGVIGLGACTSLLEDYNESLRQYEQKLTQYTYQQLSTIKHVSLLTEECPDIGLFTIRLKDAHHQDLASYLDSKGIAVRSGHHCAMPLMAFFGIEGAVRISLAAYNTKAEVDFLIEQLNHFFMGEAHSDIQIKSALSQATQSVENKSDKYSILDVHYLTVEDIKVRFEKAKSWDLKHRQIMLLAKELQRIDKTLRNDEDLVLGCESNAWLNYQLDLSNNKLIFKTDSDAKVIRGLMVIILSAFQNKTASQILKFDIDEYFTELGLMQHLSPSRGNGVKAIVERIHYIANNLA